MPSRVQGSNQLAAARLRESSRDCDTSTKDELGVLTESIRRLKAEKAALQQELVALKEASKFKEETPKIKEEIPHVKVEPGVNPTCPPALSAPNTVLADARQTFKQERDRNEALQAKCTNLETKVKESADLAAKAFIEAFISQTSLHSRFLTALDKMRVEATKMKKKIEDLEKLNAANAARAVLIEANEAYDIVKAEKKETRTASESLEAEIAAVNEKFSAVKAKYKTVKIEKEDLQQTCRELIEIVEILEMKVEANAGAAEILDDLGSRYNKADSDRAELQEAKMYIAGACDFSVDREGGRRFKGETAPSLSIPPYPEPQEEDSKAQKEYRKYMKALTPPKDHPPFATLSPACHLDTNLHAFLAKDATAKSVLNHVLYLPKRVSKTADVHFIAFGPSHRYDRVTSKWSKAPISQAFMAEFESSGTTLPSGISEREIADAALGLPRPQGYVNIIKQCYPDGNIKIVATGLQCVGFNKQLYDSLRKRFAQDLTAQTKRKADDEGNRDAKRRKD
ncbi:hypothetical protein DFH09DRAFT_1444750 [Mycena vulgaris]|nr:hypothetical protein DFH09DRAFT_1444750 [Mycena vulgaris]